MLGLFFLAFWGWCFFFWNYIAKSIFETLWGLMRFFRSLSFFKRIFLRFLPVFQDSWRFLLPFLKYLKDSGSILSILGPIGTVGANWNVTYDIGFKIISGSVEFLLKCSLWFGSWMFGLDSIQESDADVSEHLESSMQTPLLLHGAFRSISGQLLWKISPLDRHLDSLIRIWNSLWMTIAIMTCQAHQTQSKLFRLTQLGNGRLRFFIWATLTFLLGWKLSHVVFRTAI